MKTYLISDTHFNHAKIATYCDRPVNFTQTLIDNWQRIVKPDDLVIHLGDVFIGKTEGWRAIYPYLPGKKILIRGNHDRQRSPGWWMSNGFEAACDGMRYRNCWLTHEPDISRASGCDLNLHGHWRNIWHGFKPGGAVIARQPWQRLFAVEYTNYQPVEFDKFVTHPDKYQSQGRKD